MAQLMIYRDDQADSTVVSNLFIDSYMKEANDAQLKVYLYLLRMMGACQATSVSDIADKFNHTETDVLRALRYWEKLRLLDLDYDGEKALVGIHLRDLNSPDDRACPNDRICARAPQPDAASVSMPLAEAEHSTAPLYEKPSYSADQLQAFRERQETAQLLCVAESYIGKPLTPSEIRTILYLSEVLHFSDDLIDYLIQYCVEKDKKDFKYIERVALNWAKEGITTPKQARGTAARYDKNVYAIMNGLGKGSSPTAKEMEFITRWTKDYGFSIDIIIEACERTVLATDKHRFEYADGILNDWRSKDVHHKADIQRVDELHRQRKKTAAPRPSGNSFHHFAQNSYDFEALEKELVSNQGIVKK